MNREEAIDIIRKNIPHLGIGAAEMTEALNELIPELRESEDERIRRCLCAIVKWLGFDSSFFIDNSVEKTSVLAYLEKQKEQKPELVQHPPITYTYNSNASRDERLKAALLALLNSDLLKVKEGGYFTKQDLIEWVERIPTDKPAEWSEEEIGHLYTLANYIKSKGYEDDGEFLEGVANKIKRLRPSWKPSEEQMEALEECGECKRCIKELYEQLKKL